MRLANFDAPEKALRGLDENSALGPDILPSRVLKRCSHLLAPVFHNFIIAILNFEEWPILWMMHSVVPLFNHKSIYDTGNYRGIHLTSQISNVVERAIASLFVPQVIHHGAFGRNQFAYMPERSAPDALAQLLRTLISLFSKKLKIVVYCSDVSGAFDKVNFDCFCANQKHSKLQKKL